MIRTVIATAALALAALGPASAADQASDAQIKVGDCIRVAAADRHGRTGTVRLVSDQGEVAVVLLDPTTDDPAPAGDLFEVPGLERISCRARPST